MKGKQRSGFGLVFKADLASAGHAFDRRVAEHPFMFAWFLIVQLGSVYIFMHIIHFTITLEGAPDLGLSPGNVFFLIFFAFFSKSAIDSHRSMISNRALALVAAQPVKQDAVVGGKLLSTAVFNLILFYYFMAVAYIIVDIQDLAVPLDWALHNRLLLLTLAGTTIGFLMGMLGALHPAKKRAVGMWLGGLPLAVLYYVFEYDLSPSWWVLLPISALGLTGIAFMTNVFYEIYDQKSNQKEVFGTMTVPFYETLLQRVPWVSAKAKVIAVKELRASVRRKETWGTVFVVAGLFIASYFLVDRLGSYSALVGEYGEAGRLMYPLVLGALIYVGASIMGTADALSSVGKDEKAFWLTKAQPCTGDDIIVGKALSVLIQGMPLAIIGLPIPILVSGEIEAVLFTLIGTVAVFLAFVGVGARAAPKNPNFTEGAKGVPDVMTLYVVLLPSLVLGAVLVGAPYALYTIDSVLGLLGVLLSLDMGLMILYIGLKSGGRRLERMDVGF